jgi:hypothetical protein
MVERFQKLLILRPAHRTNDGSDDGIDRRAAHAEKYDGVTPAVPSCAFISLMRY